MATTFRIRPENLARLQRRFAEAPKDFYREMRQAMRLSGQDWQREMKKRTRGKTRPDGLARRTGDLARSISTKTTGTSPQLNTLRTRLVSAGVSYAPIHEFGGVVTPKRAKNLTVPMADNLTAAGDTRYPSARALFKANSSSQRAFVLRVRGKAYIALWTRGEPEPKLLWKLVKSVRIKPRLGFFNTWKKQAQQRHRRFRFALARALRGSRS